MGTKEARRLRVLAGGALATILAVGLAACERQAGESQAKGPAERVGARIDQALDQTGEQLNKIAEKTGEQMQELGRRLETEAQESQQAEQDRAAQQADSGAAPATSGQ